MEPFPVLLSYVLIICSFWQVLETTERIDIEKLKQRERICFYDDIMLFEDELSDNGCSVLSVKVVSVFTHLVCVCGGEGGGVCDNVCLFNKKNKGPG